MLLKRLIFHRIGHLTSKGASPAAIFMWYLPSDHKLYVLSRYRDRQWPNRSKPTARQRSPTAVCPPTIQYQDINFWKFLSTQTAAHGNIFIRPKYDNRICDRKLPLTRLLLLTGSDITFGLKHTDHHVNRPCKMQVLQDPAITDNIMKNL